MPPDAAVRAVTARPYTIPTDAPEADGTYAWRETTLVITTIEAGGQTGLGYTYSSSAAASLASGPLAAALSGQDAFDIPLCHRLLVNKVRNMGRSGLAATAISALDAALWDLKAKLMDLPLAALLGRARETVPIYGSGGFTSYKDRELRQQLAGWVERDGCRAVKMKIGSHPDDDLRRVGVAKEAIGEASLFVDANGAYSVKQALRMADAFAAEAQVAWFEEPVSSDDLDGLAQVRTGAPDCMDIAAGEYSYNADDVRHMLVRRAVDVQQADASRCLGITGFLQAGGALRRPSHRPFRSLCACASCSPCLRGAALAPSGMVSRPRTHRAHAVRGRSRREERRDPPGHEPSRAWALCSRSGMRSATLHDARR